MPTKGHSTSISLVVILFYIYVLTTATLHQCRSKDKYQNRVAGLIFWMFWVDSVAGRLEWIKAHDSGHWLSLLLVALVLCLSASAVAHAGIGWLKNVQDAESEPKPTRTLGRGTEEGGKEVQL